MDVFDDAETYRAHLLPAALWAADALDLFAAADGQTLAGLAARVGAAPARLRALVEVLRAEGFLVQDGARWNTRRNPPRVAAPPGPFARLAEVLRSDRPLTLAPDEEARFLDAVAARGRAPAVELWRRLGGEGALFDAGGGHGAFTAAWLAAGGARRATLFDRPHVIDGARARLGDDARLTLAGGDLLVQVPPGPFDAALLSNVLHLYGAGDAAAIVARVMAAVRPGGRVVVKDLWLDDARGGPPAGLWFALVMALYTPAGTTHRRSDLRQWLIAAGAAAVEELTLSAAAAAVVLVGAKP
jgi:hypothetical protein